MDTNAELKNLVASGKASIEIFAAQQQQASDFYRNEFYQGKEILELVDGMQKLKKRETRAAQQFASIQEAEASTQEAVRMALKEIADIKRDHDYKKKEVAHAQTYFEDNLGLCFRRNKSGDLRLQFSRLDPSNPERTFFFTVQVDGLNRYHVAECEPKVEQRQIEILLAEVNATNNFGVFVRKFRKLFRALVQ